MDSEEETADWFAFLETTEPEFFNYVNDMSAMLVSSILKSTNLDMKRTTKIIRSMVLAFVAGYILKYNQNNKLLKASLENMKDRIFERWMDGLMEDEFYAYQTDGMDQTSTAYVAKHKHEELKRRKSREREIVKSRQLFDSMCASVMDMRNGGNGDYRQDHFE